MKDIRSIFFLIASNWMALHSFAKSNKFEIDVIMQIFRYLVYRWIFFLMNFHIKLEFVSCAVNDRICAVFRGSLDSSLILDLFSKNVRCCIVS